MFDYDAMLKQIPPEWNTKKIGELGDVVSGGTPSRGVSSFWEGDIPWLTPGEVSKYTGKYLSNTEEYITESGLNNSGANLLPEGSLLVTSRATLGARVINAVPMTTNQGFKSVTFYNDCDSSFYYHFFELLKSELIRRASGTTFLEISGSEFSDIDLPVPQEKEKKLIVELLDTLDTQICQSEAIIVKLQQVKQGLLHDLLTRGVDENGELRPTYDNEPHLYKPSKLGWIPKDWGIAPLDDVVSYIDAGKSPSCPNEPAPSGCWGVLKVSAVHPDGFKESENKIVESKHLQNSQYEVKDGDLLITRANTPELVGLPCLVRTERTKLMLSDKTLRLHVKDGFSKEFVFYTLNQPWVRTQIEILATGTSMSMKNISQKSIRSLLIKLPDEPEQVAIQERVKQLSDSIDIERSQLEKLKLQKSGLMNDLLTGRVRVTELLNQQN